MYKYIYIYIYIYTYLNIYRFLEAQIWNDWSSLVDNAVLQNQYIYYIHIYIYIYIYKYICTYIYIYIYLNIYRFLEAQIWNDWSSLVDNAVQQNQLRLPPSGAGESKNQKLRYI
jgi:predicted SnoaL-like aldol condensation-catalyzing enzyme